MLEELELFKQDIEQYVKQVYTLILEDYGEFLPIEKRNLINDFDCKKDIIIDDGGKYSKGPGRWESRLKKLALSPFAFYESTYKNEIKKEVPYMDIELIEKKLKNSANETFTGSELANLIRQKKLTCLDITKGIVIHEVFHSVITMKMENEIFRIDYKGKTYDCKGVKGEYLEEGLVEYYARKFADKHNLFMFPSIPYQKNIEYAKRIEKELGSNMNKLLFKGNYKTLLNYIHKVGMFDEYHEFENIWLNERMTKRLKKMKDEEEFIEFNEIEELKLI